MASRRGRGRGRGGRQGGRTRRRRRRGGVTLVSALELTPLAEKVAYRYLWFPTVSVERKRGEVKVRSDGQAQKKKRCVTG